jgi:isopentenyl-diphosphate delta-isomerase
MNDLPADADQMIPAWDADGVLRPHGKLEVHQKALRHPAISVFINGGGVTLLQKRAAGKYHTPGLWANACCTHPHWGEDLAACAHRRIGEELGLDLPLTLRGEVEYRADVGRGLTEHEVVNLFVGAADPATLKIAPNPAEVEAVRWITLPDLRAEIAATPEAFTPWLRIYLAEHEGRIFET